MERICLGAKKVDNNDSPFYATETEEMIRLKKTKKSYSMVNRGSET